MSVEGSIAGLLRGFLCRESRDERQVRVLVERLWDLSRTDLQASFWRAVERGEDDVHHLHEWEELLGLVGSRQRFGELQEFLDNVQQIFAPDWDPSDSDQWDREMAEETDAAAPLDQDRETIPDHHGEVDWDWLATPRSHDLRWIMHIRRILLERRGLGREALPGAGGSEGGGSLAAWLSQAAGASAAAAGGVSEGGGSEGEVARGEGARPEG